MYGKQGLTINESINIVQWTLFTILNSGSISIIASTDSKRH